MACEHTGFSVYREPLQREIWRRYHGLDAVVVLGEPERAPLEGAAPVWVIPNAAPRCAGPPARLEAPVVMAAGRLCGPRATTA